MTQSGMDEWIRFLFAFYEFDLHKIVSALTSFLFWSILRAKQNAPFDATLFPTQLRTAERKLYNQSFRYIYLAK